MSACQVWLSGQWPSAVNILLDFQNKASWQTYLVMTFGLFVLVSIWLLFVAQRHIFVWRSVSDKSAAPCSCVTKGKEEGHKKSL